MHTVTLLQEGIRLAEQLGYQLRHEWLGGSGGGGCELRGRKWIFLDLTLGPAEHLDVVLDVLRREPQVAGLAMSSHLRQLLQRRQAA